MHYLYEFIYVIELKTIKKGKYLSSCLGNCFEILNYVIFFFFFVMTTMILTFPKFKMYFNLGYLYLAWIII